MYSNLISHQFIKVILLLVAFDVNICIVFYQIKIYDYDYDYDYYRSTVNTIITPTCLLCNMQ